MAEEVSAVVYMVNCETCGSLRPIETVQAEWIDGKPVTWEHRCATCGTAFGFIMDGGTLDLGVITDSVVNQAVDIGLEIFPDPPPGH